MAFEKLSSDEQRVIWECLNAIRMGKFIDDFEFQTRLGAERGELDDVISTYPYLNDSESAVRMVMNNCLNEVAYGIDLTDQKWSMWFSVPRERITEIYLKWAKLTELQSTGLTYSAAQLNATGAQQ